ncbi:hypothetical protein VTK73DRAFT_6338 [Phialemonium thermophilum]|uniref:ABC transporter domain-containing protein n=1 Tax=Phialemonium thermophilum TaxID=223376 RepID=A0ABR3UZM1_9PEZI
MGRIEAFMAEPDKDEDDEEEQDHDDGRGRERAAAATTTTPPPPEEDLRIAVRGASFSWPGASRIVLRDVTFACRPGLTLVCGVVGAGKTALLHAILGELDQHGGQREVPSETIGYCAQTPWLESMSIRENILFCAAYDEQRERHRPVGRPAGARGAGAGRLQPVSHPASRRPHRRAGPPDGL